MGLLNDLSIVRSTVYSAAGNKALRIALESTLLARKGLRQIQLDQYIFVVFLNSFYSYIKSNDERVYKIRIHL